MRFFFLLALAANIISAQESIVVSGYILDKQAKEPLENVMVYIEGNQVEVQTQTDGFFQIPIPKEGEYILNISLTDYLTKRIPISLENRPLDLGTVYLEKDIAREKTDNLITLTDSDLSDDDGASITSGLLQATRDVFLNRAAFDFGQAFFRVRGYDSQNGRVLINGIPMNKFFDGRPQWNNWGGLNDVIRNQQFTNGLEASDYTFGGILGNTNIDARPSGLRPGTRLSSSISNRTYAGRVMATYSSGVKQNGLSYTVSGSRRWAEQGYIEGTLYDAFSFFGAVEYQFDKKNSASFTSIMASNRRGRSSAITEEVFNLAGKQYNPYWGEQNGEIRNSRERKIVEPIFMLNHFYTSDKLNLNTGISYQFGKNARSRLGYYNAPNPDPTYYRYLPSFYINSPIGANFISANLAREGFLENPQIQWNDIYTANTDEKAAYVLYDDIAEDTQLTLNTIGNLEISDRAQVDIGITYKNLDSDNYAKIADLLGAGFHQDIDPFSNTLNDVNGTLEKREGDIFNYRYAINVSSLDGFAQLRLNYDSWNGYVAANYSNTNYQRKGVFLNERFLENSIGLGKRVSFTDFGFKGGFTYKITGRHWVTLNAAHLKRAPVLQNIFINPRENNEVVPNVQSETVTTADLNYFIRLPKLTGRITGFYTRFQNTTDVNFFFVDAGVGSDFVQEVLTDLDKLHLGGEIGLEYQLSSSVKISAVAAIGKYVYASNPSVSINFDTAGAEEDLINPDGAIDLGMAAIKDYKLAQGPQQAYAFGIEYRDPKYWWIGATTNYLANNYANISTITRTQSFLLDPETGEAFPGATPENVAKLLDQKPLDNFYLLNLVGGKSWLKNGKYISLFASINNAFDAVFRTGGYEQSRNGNFGQLQQDNLSGTPSFAPKYWYGYGRTYFLNLAFSF
ncbi:carboxypeptidase-like regulatory domain-containing protein [Costertonia aggregata]|uniref:Carboxypeptidase-like regulatory domain-containing protein n=1 Tax=Costertonia aggregata TaxID=343403 RepID=A0A7H9AQ50_9FLAO|nr:carboxypeptidase-like regulatory domain-containing protein [Costertonia aggregata]QLG45568.1 carboxypeptidase-like regulatory domain-containing protein [Costertonia aggregata]